MLTDINADKDWRDAIRSSACERFMTVLGPGSDGYHEEHVHLDLEPRRNDYKICEWDVRVPPAPVVAQAKETDPAQTAQLAQAEGVALQGLDPPLIPEDEVPLPRPRPLAANTARRKSARSEKGAWLLRPGSFSDRKPEAPPGLTNKAPQSMIFLDDDRLAVVMMVMVMMVDDHDRIGIGGSCIRHDQPE